jgi:hypothetical protein
MHNCLLLALNGHTAFKRYKVNKNFTRKVPGKESLGRRRGKIHNREKY